jgi:hypothetical protein
MKLSPAEAAWAGLGGLVDHQWFVGPRTVPNPTTPTMS